ncbi:hypothetical protein cce_2641 [Crocosphaera subtropica ATCC 51142]|uniref:Transposase n=1 Tax=Crocosphaera subtropica (strain ATCC 51142 / BH68) TaxID=43989 RepID=B1WT67_CROS5|nr:hypothetical protein cce_2641 [Crocosphaera subtropica ATCC 51142]
MASLVGWIEKRNPKIQRTSLKIVLEYSRLLN